MKDFLTSATGIAMMIVPFFAWLTALIQSASNDAWALFVTSLIFPPWGMLVGVGYWIGEI